MSCSLDVISTTCFKNLRNVRSRIGLHCSLYVKCQTDHTFLVTPHVFWMYPVEQKHVYSL
uniref:Uncharacterized protein n=1 Tax=Arabidopsis thaliana TaxID=3702 RepID=Q0WSN8_ARATH|nr:hypothetical protein [Arabidopsis thaliana]